MGKGAVVEDLVYIRQIKEGVNSKGKKDCSGDQM